MSPITIPALTFQPDEYETQLTQKQQQLSQLTAPFTALDAMLFRSPQQHFRMRAEFRIWHHIDEVTGRHECFYAMFEKNNPKQPIKIEQFPIASLSITTLMQPLIDEINQCLSLSKKLFQIEFLSSSTGEVLVSLIYHRPLDDDWAGQAKQLEERLNISIIGRSRKQRIVISKDFVLETLCINNISYRYQQQENSFTQPNAAVNQKMISWVCDYLVEKQDNTPDASTDLLELYCGNGNFTIPLARHFRKVLATEISKTGIQSAQKNCQLNQVSNIDFIRLSSAETVTALDRKRDFRRLKHISLDEYRFSTIMVDPPRAGLDDITLALAARFEQIIYISCNPLSLVDNLRNLTQTHEIKQLALFDQFPYSHHCECGVIMQRVE